MPSVTCDACTREISFPEKLAGKAVKCPQCGERVRLQKPSSRDDSVEQTESQPEISQQDKDREIEQRIREGAKERLPFSKAKRRSDDRVSAFNASGLMLLLGIVALFLAASRGRTSYDDTVLQQLVLTVRIYGWLICACIFFAGSAICRAIISK